MHVYHRMHESTREILDCAHLRNFPQTLEEVTADDGACVLIYRLILEIGMYNVWISAGWIDWRMDAG